MVTFELVSFICLSYNVFVLKMQPHVTLQKRSLHFIQYILPCKKKKKRKKIPSFYSRQKIVLHLLQIKSYSSFRAKIVFQKEATRKRRKDLFISFHIGNCLFISFQTENCLTSFKREVKTKQKQKNFWWYLALMWLLS